MTPSCVQAALTLGPRARPCSVRVLGGCEGSLASPVSEIQRRPENLDSYSTDIQNRRFGVGYQGFYFSHSIYNVYGLFGEWGQVVQDGMWSKQSWTWLLLLFAAELTPIKRILKEKERDITAFGRRLHQPSKSLLRVGTTGD